MILHAYSILDSKTGIFSQPWFFNHDQSAYRAVKEAGSSKDNNLGKYPEDFHLYKIGAFNDSTAEFTQGQLQAMGSIASLLASE